MIDDGEGEKYSLSVKECKYTGKGSRISKRNIIRGRQGVLLVLSVDNRQRPLAMEIVSIGTVDMAPVNPREIFKHAILVSAANIIVIHNHTSGDCTPSLPDVELTERLIKAGEILGIPVADHVIVGDGYFSFREEDMRPKCEEDFLYIAS